MRMKDYNLERFIRGQRADFNCALAEIRVGRKQSHWMWYIFPQLKELSQRGRALYYGIEDIDEARAYMEEPYLHENLIKITRALLELHENDPYMIMGYPDNLKLCSCMTLFEIAAPDVIEFGMVLDKFYNGVRDDMTIEILKQK